MQKSMCATFTDYRVISTPQGNKVITSMKDVVEILNNNNLSELSEFIGVDVNNRILSAEANLVALQDEFDSYEMQNEEYHDCIRDNADNIAVVINSINNSKRLNKSELVKRLTEIHDNLYSQV